MEEALLTNAQLLRLSVQVGLTIVLTLIVTLVIFLMIRRLVLWYFKLDKISEYLRVIASALVDFRAKETKSWECPKCKQQNSNETFTCRSCGYRLK